MITYPLWVYNQSASPPRWTFRLAYYSFKSSSSDEGGHLATEQWTLHFNRATIKIIVGRPMNHLADGIFVPANQRAVMAAGLAGEVRMAAGSTVEDELRRQLPLLPGSAYLTGSGALDEGGVRHIAHGVIVREPGSAPRVSDAIAALESALQLLEGAGDQTVTFPFVTSRLSERRPGDNARNLAEIVIGHLRRRSRLSTITCVGLDATFAEQLQVSLLELGASSTST